MQYAGISVLLLLIAGSRCETDIDECLSSPCLNGVCSHGVASYSCDCTGTGYEGSQCQTDENDCVPDPCLHGASCSGRSSISAYGDCYLIS